LHQNEPWFVGSTEETEAYLLSRHQNFWNNISV